jgi:hypothetical protein
VNGVAPDLIVHFGDLLALRRHCRGDEGVHIREREPPGRREPRPGGSRARRPRRLRASARRASPDVRRPRSSCRPRRSRLDARTPRLGVRRWPEAPCLRPSAMTKRIVD